MPASESDILLLNCCILDEEHIFSVKIPKIDTVSILKKFIKEEKKPLFDSIPADTLDLWKVSTGDIDSVKADTDPMSGFHPRRQKPQRQPRKA
jgi:hypothetical protein